MYFFFHNTWLISNGQSPIKIILSAYLVKREAVIILQTNFRALRYRIQFKRLRRAAITIQASLSHHRQCTTYLFFVKNFSTNNYKVIYTDIYRDIYVECLLDGTWCRWENRNALKRKGGDKKSLNKRDYSARKRWRITKSSRTPWSMYQWVRGRGRGG